MKQNGMYWALFAPMIKSSTKKRFGKELAKQAVNKGKSEYKTLVAEAPNLGRGLGEIMTPLCETDKVMFAYQHGKLYRNNTIAYGGDICDYWSVGDMVQNPY